MLFGAFYRFNGACHVNFSAVQPSITTAMSNALTPKPTWSFTSIDPVPTSAIPPSDLQQYGALDFPLLQTIGEEFMVKSNVNNWIACLPGSGSFSGWVQGSITCRMINSITSTCADLPTGQYEMGFTSRGPLVRRSNNPYYIMYFWDSSTDEFWPANDPCSANEPNHIPDLMLKGQIWLRWKTLILTALKSMPHSHTVGNQLQTPHDLSIYAKI